MTRIAKSIGPTLFAVFALGALSASASPAAEVDHINAEEPALLTAEAKDTEENVSPQVFEAVTGSEEGVVCKKVAVHGEVEETQDHVTVEPTYSECAVNSFPVTVDTNGCHYDFTGETTEGNPTGGKHATVHLKDCKEGKEHIEVTVTSFNLKCLSIPEQKVQHAVRYESKGNGKVMITITAHGIESTTTESFAGCGKEVHTDGSYTGDVTVSAHNEVEEPVDLSLSEPSPAHHIDAEEPALLTAEAKDTEENVSPQVFEAVTGSEEALECKVVEVNGTVVETQDQVTVEPIYKECTAPGGFQLTIDTNGCHYLFTGETTTGNPTGGEHATVHLTDCKEGKEHIELTVTSFGFKCISFPEQEIQHAVRYEDKGNGKVMITITAHGIESTTTESFAGCGEEVHTDGSYTGDVTVSAHSALEEPVNLSLTENAT